MNTSFNVYYIFNDPVFRTIFLAGLERQLNIALSLDPVTISRLCSMSNIVINIQCSEPRFQFYVYLGGDSIKLGSFNEGEADLCLRGSIAVLVGLVVIRRHRIDAVPGLKFWGRDEVLQQLSDILQSAELDWHGLLCQYFGSITGHLLARGFDLASSQAGKTKAIVVDNIKEYLQEELLFLPSRNELESFAADIAELKVDIDNIEGFIHEFDA